MPEFWKSYDRLVRTLLGSLTPAQGVSVAKIAAAERRLGFRLPRRLAAYYRRTGRHAAINQVHNRLIPLERLQIEDDRLAFFEENQWVVLWAIAKADLALADPPVYQGVSIADQDERDWHLESRRLSTFLLETFCWQMVMGGLPNVGHGTLGQPGLTKVRRQWRTILRNKTSGMETYQRDGQVLCIFPKKGKKRADFYVGAKTPADLNLLDAVGPNWHYAETTDGEDD